MSDDSIAFTVYGVPITIRQRDAALAAMTEEFPAYAVDRALVGAGVPWFVPGSNQPCVSEAANRLLQFERKAGRIRYIGKSKWIKT